MFSFLIIILFNILYAKCSEDNEETFLNVYCRLCLGQEHNFKVLADTHLDECIRDCETKNVYDVSKDIIPNKKEMFTPKLQCRTEHELTFYWNSTEIKFYILELQNKSSDWMPVTTTKENIYTFQNLSKNKEYRTRIWGMMPVQNFWGPLESDWYSTSEHNTSALEVPHISISNIEIMDKMLEISVNWSTVTDERVCFYEIIWFSDDGDELNLREIEKTKQEFEEKIDNIKFETLYHIGIKTKTGSQNQESDKYWIKYISPPCYEVYNNVSICPPPTPLNVSIKETIVSRKQQLGQFMHDLKVTWEEPVIYPDNYIIKITRLLQNTSRSNDTAIEKNIPGNETSVEFKDIVLGLQYYVSVSANSSGGISAPAILHRYLADLNTLDSSYQHHALFLTGILFSLVILVVAFSIVFCYYKKIKQNRVAEACVYFQGYEDGENKINQISKDEIVPNHSKIELEKDCWEIPSHRLILESDLGEGEFGLVKKGWIKDFKGNTLTPVAVKMLKESTSSEQTRQFLSEINIMKSVGSHPNLVSIIGCCVNDKPPYSLMLVVEYCALGDLQNYLRTAWNHIMTNSSDYANITEQLTNNIAVNQLYEIDNTKHNFILQSCDLLSFARQIARGMEFLSSLKVLHRDLAARNVLVCEDKCVKVADFGLSRDVYRDNIYQKSGNSKVPIKWMAIESLTHQLYTTQSDVWSFGILLWEIVTLGGNPYPSVQTNKLLELLLSGYRMEKPNNCGTELYNLMYSCWRARPKERPTFTQLRQSLDKLLESSTAATYLKLDVFSTSELATLYNPIDS